MKLRSSRAVTPLKPRPYRASMPVKILIYQYDDTEKANLQFASITWKSLLYKMTWQKYHPSWGTEVEALNQIQIKWFNRPTYGPAEPSYFWFSHRGRTSKRALAHWEKVGILKPLTLERQSVWQMQGTLHCLASYSQIKYVKEAHFSNGAKENSKRLSALSFTSLLSLVLLV